MHRDRHAVAFCRTQQRVLGGEHGVEFLRRIKSLVEHLLLQSLRHDEAAVARCVDLDIGDAIVGDGLDLVRHQPREILEEILPRRIGAVADAGSILRRNERDRARQRHLERAGRMLLHELDFVTGDAALLLQLVDHHGNLWHEFLAVFDILAGQRGITRVVDAAVLEAVEELVGDRGQPERAAEFAVGIDFNAGVALHLQHVKDRRVLDRSKLGVVDPAVQTIEAGPAQFFGTYQAAAMVGAEDWLCHKGEPCFDCEQKNPARPRPY